MRTPGQRSVGRWRASRCREISGLTLLGLHRHTPSSWSSRPCVEHDYRELKTALGLDHFEGRSWIGWHRHVTLAAAAQLFLTHLRLTRPKATGQT